MSKDKPTNKYTQRQWDRTVGCGAKLWIETDSDVIIHDKTTYAEVVRG